jgi:hypothetical protein
VDWAAFVNAKSSLALAGQVCNVLIEEKFPYARLPKVV